MNGDSTAMLYGAPTSVFVIGDTPPAIARGAAAVVAAGFVVSARAGIEDADTALAAGSRPGLVFVEIDGVSDADADRLDSLLTVLDGEADRGRSGVIVSTPVELIDAVAARVRHPRMVQLAGARDEDRAVALAHLALPLGAGVRDPRGDAGGSEAARLRFLTDEVGRIAATLGRLSGIALPPGQTGAPVDDVAGNGDADTSDTAALFRIVRARRLRGRHFDPALFADPAWDMLLDLTGARIAGKPVAVSSLCIAAAVPATTALRWIRMLTDTGLFVRQADPADGRRVFIDLSEEAAAAMRSYLAALRSKASWGVGASG